VLPEDLFPDQTATLLNPIRNLGIDRTSGQERLHDRFFVGLDQGVRRFVGEGAETHHEPIFPSRNVLSIAVQQYGSRARSWSLWPGTFPKALPHPNRRGDLLAKPCSLRSPIAQLAQTQQQIHQRLQDITPIDADADLQALWQAQAEQLLDPAPPVDIKELTDQLLVLVTCRDEKEQTELLGRLTEEGRE
jgi:hypothetical protein